MKYRLYFIIYGCLLLLLAFITAAAAADPESQGGTQPIRILPPHPMAGDAITITISSSWGTACVPTCQPYELWDDVILFDCSYWGGPCPYIVTDWSDVQSVGVLSKGPYQVDVYMTALLPYHYPFDPLPYTYLWATKDFVVAEEIYYLPVVLK